MEIRNGKKTTETGTEAENRSQTRTDQQAAIGERESRRDNPAVGHIQTAEQGGMVSDRKEEPHAG
jgi:hypothetical protein